MFEKENIFYEEKCNTTDILDRCMANCAEALGDWDLQGQSGNIHRTKKIKTLACLDKCNGPYICEEAKSYYNSIFVIFRRGLNAVVRFLNLKATL